MVVPAAVMPRMNRITSAAPRASVAACSEHRAEEAWRATQAESAIQWHEQHGDDDARVATQQRVGQQAGAAQCGDRAADPDDPLRTEALGQVSGRIRREHEGDDAQACITMKVSRPMPSTCTNTAGMPNTNTSRPPSTSAWLSAWRRNNHVAQQVQVTAAGPACDLR